MKNTLHFSQVPDSWAICYQSDCPLAATCLRYRAATLAPADLQHHECVLPGARRADSCDCFVEDSMVRMARGMRHLLPPLGYEEGIALRRQLYEIFGSKSQYYRYRDGLWPIPPSKQRRVADLFRQFGLEGEPKFDAYTEGFCLE